MPATLALPSRIADDLLDVVGDADKAGKALRKDEGQGKQTFVTLMGVDKARRTGPRIGRSGGLAARVNTAPKPMCCARLPASSSSAIADFCG